MHKITHINYMKHYRVRQKKCMTIQTAKKQSRAQDTKGVEE